jgi:hypothetical protein
MSLYGSLSLTRREHDNALKSMVSLSNHRCPPSFDKLRML